MKNNRSYGSLVTVYIVFGLGLIAMGVVYFKNLDAIKETNSTTPVGEPLLEHTQMIPNNTDLRETDLISTPGGPGRLRINLDAYPQVLDPQRAVLPKEIAFLDLMYEGLTRLDENLNAVPAAAESWAYAQDAAGMVFTLRPGLKYSDGSPLNAMRFEAALRRLIDPATESEFAWLVEAIQGAPEWQAANPAAPGYNEQAFLSGLGVQATDLDGKPCSSYAQLDCLVLRLVFSQPAPHFHYVMGLWITYPTRLDLVGAGRQNWWLQAEKRTGNGRFVLTDLDPFVKARFTANPEYAGELPKVAVEFYFISDPQTALQAYQNNQLEILDRSFVSELIADSIPASQLVIGSGACSSMIQFNLHPIGEGQPSPFADPKVRQAFVLAFDHQAWQRDVAGDGSLFTGTFIPPGFAVYDAGNAAHVFDPELAWKTLEESSYGGLQALNDLGLKLTFPDTPLNRARYGWLADNYRRHLGVDFLLEPMDETAFAETSAGQSELGWLAFQTWCALIPDPHGWLNDYWQDGSPFRPDTGYENPGLEAILAAAGVAAPAPERLRLYAQAEQMLIADTPAIFGWVSTNQYQVKPWVKGLVTSPYDMVWPGSKFPERIVIEP